MSRSPLSIDSLPDIHGGTARVMINKEISKAVADLDDRGKEDGKSRKVVIELELSIDPDKDIIVMQVAAQAKLPPRRSGATIAELKQNADQPLLYFQTLAPENPKQNTFEALDKDDVASE